VDAAAAGDEVVVTDGIYATGGRPAGTNILANRVAVEKPLTLHSVNGPQFTIIQGHQTTDNDIESGAFRCVYLSSGANLSGFTLTNGMTPPYAESSGGGVWCGAPTAVVSNCVIIGNFAYYGGGGAYGGTLNSCIVTSNSAVSFGGGAASCALNNCTLTGNAAEFPGGVGGGAESCTLTNCTLSANLALNGGGADNCTLSNCILDHNSANDDSEYLRLGYGGGSAESILVNCTLTNNSAIVGGGAAGCTLNNCSLNSNRVQNGYVVEPGDTISPYGGYGGGAYSCTLNDCMVSSNSAVGGGGASYATLSHCTVVGNLATGVAVGIFDDVLYNGAGGGALQSTLNDCVLYGNSARRDAYGDGGSGGGTYGGALNNCTVSGNSASYGGGVSSGTLNNCIVYSNTAGMEANYDLYSALNFCCTAPMPTNGIGNISNAPLFVDVSGGNLRLQPGSPCIDAGDSDYVTTATDLDGNPRILGGTVDIGAYEFVSPELLFEYLTGLVSESSLSARQPLLASLGAAMSSLGRGNATSAINQLQAFQNKVRAQVEPVDSELAAELTRLAQEIVGGALDAEKGATK
jgi:hypothetical protein